MSDLQTILKALEENRKSHAVDIWVPSLNRTEKFTTLSHQDQEDILKYSVSRSHTNPSFIAWVDKTILNNYLGEAPLQIYDRYAIAIMLRAHSIGPTYNTIDLLNVVDQSRVDDLEFIVNVKDETTNIELMLEMPTLERGIEVSTKLIEKLNGEALVNDEDEMEYLLDAVADHTIYEIVKYVDSISIDNIEYKLKNVMDIDEIAQLISSLPKKITIEALERISDVNTYAKSFAITSTGDTISLGRNFFSVDK